MAVSMPLPNNELPPSCDPYPLRKSFRSRLGPPSKKPWGNSAPAGTRKIYGFRPGRGSTADQEAVSAACVTAAFPGHGMGSLPPRPVQGLSSTDAAARAEMPEMDLHTPEGRLRRDVAVKVLERIDDRLAQVVRETGPSHIRLAAQRQRHALRSLANDLAAKDAAPEPRPGPAVAQASTGAGLDIEDSARLVRVLRQTRKAVCPRPSRFSRLMRRLRAASSRQVTTVQSHALLDMLLAHFDVQVLGGWAALVRENAEAVRMKKYAAYAQPGESRSTFLGGTATAPIAGVPLSASVGIVAGATILGRDLAGCEDGDVEQSRWWSGTLGAAFTFGLSWLKARLTGTVTRRKGFFFGGVDHLVRSREGNPHKEQMFDHASASLMRAMGASRFGTRNLALSDLDALEDKAYAQRDIFAKVVGPISAATANGEKKLHTIRVDKQAPRAPAPCAFESTRMEATAGASAGLDLAKFFSAGVNASIGQALLHLTLQPRQGFWQAVQGRDGDGGGMAADAWRQRVAALRDAGRRIAPALAHFSCVRMAVASPGPDAATDGFRIGEADAEQLRELLKALDQEFDGYCYARRQVEAGMPRHRARAHAIEAAWGIKPGADSMYAYIQRLHIVHALIGLRLQELRQFDDDRFDALRDKLDAPRITNYREARARPYITFCDETELVEHYTPIDFGGGLTLDLCNGPMAKAGAINPFGKENPVSANAGLSVNVRAQARTRRDSNILREGKYLDLSFDFSLNGFVGMKIPQVGESLLRQAGAMGLDTGLLGQAIGRVGQALEESLEPGLDPACFLRVRLCYYQPGGIQGRDAPRLQHVRIILGHRGPIHNQEKVIKEILGSDTLSYLFMRHHAWLSLADVKQGESRWASYCAAHSAELDEMMVKLGDPASSIRADAERYWAQIGNCMLDEAEKAGLDEKRTAFFKTMSRYADAHSLGAGHSDPEAYNEARTALDAFAAGHMAPWLQARAEQVRHRARFKLLD
jgi:hypothetical protein